MKYYKPGTIFIFISFLLIIIRWLFPERSIDQAGPIAIWNTLFTIGLWLVVLFLSSAIGRKATYYFHLSFEDALESFIFEVVVGMGIVAYGILALGLAGVLYSFAIFAWLVFLTLISIPVLFAVADEAWQAAKNIPRSFRLSSVEKKVAIILLAFLAGLVFISCLTPPTDYDSLYYHLPGPKKFLEAGRISFIEDIWQANYPFTVQMLYTLGLAFQTDSFARLINLSYTFVLCAATFSFGRRYFSSVTGWIAVFLLIGTPIFPFWASWANSDMAWAAYEFLALYAGIRWAENKKERWIMLSAVLSGFAMGTKYLALGGVLQIGLLLLFQVKTMLWRSWIRGVLLYGIFTILIASPWYLKNLIWTGNPFYPLIFGGLGWDAGRIHLFNVFHYSFGVERTALNLLTLPLQLFINSHRFITTYTIEVLNVFFLFSLMIPAIRTSHPVHNFLAILTLVRFTFWAVGTQQVRLLLPLFPALSLLSAYVIEKALENVSIRRVARIGIFAVLGGLVISTILYQVINYLQFNPIKVVVGVESKHSFLLRTTPIYFAQYEIQQQLSPINVVKMLWNGQNYYCDRRCDADNDQMEWVHLVQTFPDPTELRDQLCANKVSHMLLNGDLEWILNYHDPEGFTRRSIDFFLNEFQPYAHMVKNYNHSVLFTIDCPASGK